ncbi:MAG: hypothetical protein JRH20_07885 [Deltaproteobacteria bacterium]|nr:hypothetical protein [Deltaproteobacteria bacterium]
MIAPPLLYRFSPTLPPQVARSRATECTGKLLGAGARMEVYPMVDEQTVIRVPRRTEAKLIAEHGSSGRKVLAAGHELSNVTEQELHDIEAIESFIGAFIPDTTPFPDLDLEGNFRYYSLQRRVRPTMDLRDNTARLATSHSLRSLERFIRDVRDMLSALSILPDLAGKGNLVLDRYGLVKLVDINNFRRLLPNDELQAALPNDLEDYVLGLKDIRKVLPEDFVDDMGLPIGDLTLARLMQLEVRALGRSLADVRTDPIYAPLYHEKRRIVLGLLRSEMA